MKLFSVTFLPTSDLVAQPFRASLPGLCRAESLGFEPQTNRTTFSPRTVYRISSFPYCLYQFSTQAKCPPRRAEYGKKVTYNGTHNNTKNCNCTHYNLVVPSTEGFSSVLRSLLATCHVCCLVSCLFGLHCAV